MEHTKECFLITVIKTYLRKRKNWTEKI
jgi:hypothetical protein